VLPIRNATLTGPWFAPHEPFLLDKGGDRGTYIGQRLSTAGDDGWAIRGGVHWHPDGTRITWGEWLGPDRTDSRLFIGTFPNMTPVPPIPPQETPIPTWAPLLQDVELRPLLIHRVLQGQASGTVELAFRGRLPKGHFKSVFKGYSADGEHVLNGEMLVQVQQLGVAQIRSDIQLSGGHTGFLKVDLQITGNEITGSAVSEKDGERFEKHFE
jgi:hypothetical protein